ncbi:MAG: peptidase Ste24p, partial [Chloroflexi bacterium]|nr:peptidase Ste24p [Chloroflexota bacterium]
FLAVLWKVTGSLALLVIVGAGLVLFQYFVSDKLVLLSTGARLVSEQEEPELHRIIERLAQIVDLPKPGVAIMETQVPNAFATGRSPKHAVIAVTRGIVALLEPQELESVLAHEMSHIKNRDMMVLTYASLFASVASFIVQIGMWTGFGGGFGGGRDDRDGNNSAAVVFLVSAVVWAVSFFLLRALSRYREYAADRGSVLITGAPATMRSALLKVSGTMQRIPNSDLRTAQSMNAFFIVPQVKSAAVEIFSTHPSLEHRLARLEAMERNMNQVGR